jgi:hypothetical protein
MDRGQHGEVGMPFLLFPLDHALPYDASDKARELVAAANSQCGVFRFGLGMASCSLAAGTASASACRSARKHWHMLGRWRGGAAIPATRYTSAFGFSNWRFCRDGTMHGRGRAVGSGNGRSGGSWLLGCRVNTSRLNEPGISMLDDLAGRFVLQIRNPIDWVIAE